MNLGLAHRLLIVALVTTMSGQSFLLWRMSERQTDLAKTARTAMDETDESIELALTWKDIAQRWQSLFLDAADRCPAVQGRAL